MDNICKAILPALFVASCAAQAEINQIGPDRYAVNVGAMGIGGGEAGARNKALSAANEYCRKFGKQVRLVTLQSKGPVEWGSAAGSASAVFDCVAQ